MTTALDLLKTDHKKVRTLLGQLAEASERASKTRAALLSQIGEELRVHGMIEEEIFYPALREAGERDGDKKTVKLVAEAYEEHRVAVELVLGDLEQTPPESVEFGGRAKVLKELIEHHADEEEDEMFKAARKHFDTAQLKALGEEMKARKLEAGTGARRVQATRR
jgi:iron-sulfur cluster repair protein YtfE (RIC family)